MRQARVTVVTVVFGNRWNLLRQVANAVLADPQATTFVIVDNGCSDPEAMDAYVAEYGERVVVLRQTRNIGYSGAIAKGLEYARTTDCDRVLVLDDDSVPEKGAIDQFLANLDFFPDPDRVVLAGNRVDVADNAKIFSRTPSGNIMPRGTLFEVFSFRKFVDAIRLVFRIPKPAKGQFTPIVPVPSLVTGGSFIPIQAVRDVPLPDASLFLYGEDLEYSWRMRARGYSCYICALPVIRDIDLTFSKEGEHIFSLFRQEFQAYKVYFRIRNAVIISRRNTVQHPVGLFANIAVWTLGLLCIGLLVAGPGRTYVSRAGLILRAVRDGYKSDRTPPSYLAIPK